MTQAIQSIKEQLGHLEKIFPLKVESYGFDYGMGGNGTRYRLKTKDNEVICYSDYAPRNIDEINNSVANLINLLKEDK